MRLKVIKSAYFFYEAVGEGLISVEDLDGMYGKALYEGDIWETDLEEDEAGRVFTCIAGLGVGSISDGVWGIDDIGDFFEVIGE